MPRTLQSQTPVGEDPDVRGLVSYGMDIGIKDGIKFSLDEKRVPQRARISADTDAFHPLHDLNHVTSPAYGTKYLHKQDIGTPICMDERARVDENRTCPRPFLSALSAYAI